MRRNTFFSLFISGVLASLGSAHGFDIRLTDVVASHQQANYPASRTIDGNLNGNNGWAIAGQTNQTQTIIWDTDGVVGYNSLEQVRLTLNFAGGGGANNPNAYNIRLFDIAYTTDANPSIAGNWTVVTPGLALATNNTVLQIAGNDVELQGNGAPNCEYFIDFEVVQSGITGFRLRAKNTPNGVGTKSGNFILTEATFSLPKTSKVVAMEGTAPNIAFLPLTSPVPGAVAVFQSVAATATLSSDFGSFSNRSELPNSDGNYEFSIIVQSDAQTEGLEYFVVEQQSGALLASDTIYVVIGDPDAVGYENYISSFGLVGDDAVESEDPNNDGVNNLESYVFRLNPVGSNTATAFARLPRFTVQSGRGGDIPAITWMLPAPYPSDIEFEVYSNDGLLDENAASLIAKRGGYGFGSLWSGSVSNAISDNISGLVRNVVIPSGQPIGTSDRQFLYLKVKKRASGNIGGAE